VLGAIVFFIAVRTIDLRGLRDIRRESPGEFVLAVFTAAVVVLVEVEQGILLAMVLSLLRIVRHSYRPHTGVFVVNEGDIWQVVPAVPGAVTKPGLVIYRFGAALFYANASLFAEQIRGLVGPTPSPCASWSSMRKQSRMWITRRPAWYVSFTRNWLIAELCWCSLACLPL
jgi:SulP family sulfate permease